MNYDEDPFQRRLAFAICRARFLAQALFPDRVGSPSSHDDHPSNLIQGKLSPAGSGLATDGANP